ncbi:MAG: transposase [Candidatus Obscuribacter sp.]|nr:transposase [Candidatus Obscuribacter sp.]
METQAQRRITKCGSKLMRWMLVQSAWSAIRGSSNLRACYSQIGRRRAKKPPSSPLPGNSPLSRITF